MPYSRLFPRPRFSCVPKPADVSAYLALTKPLKFYRTLAAAGFALLLARPIAVQEWPGLLFAVCGGMLAAAGANVLNMYTDRVADASCRRTALRPLAAQRLSPRNALALAFALIAVATVILFLLVSPTVAMLALVVVGLYAVPYAYLKHKTPYYTLVGGAVWAAPIPVLWIAAGKPLGIVPLAGFIFAAAWTALHTWSAALPDAGAYSMRGVLFMPLTFGLQATRIHVLSLVLLIAATTILLRQWDMLPFDAGLLAACAVACLRGTSKTDRLLSRAAVVYASVYVCTILIKPISQ